jgi:hypothetical protein
VTRFKSTSYPDRYDEDAIADFNGCVVESGERIRFTAKGRLPYGARFGKTVIDIRTIKTRGQFEQAL